MLYDVRDPVLVSVFNYACVSADSAQCMFRQIMNKTDKVVDKDMSSDKDFANENDISAVSEWDLMSLPAFFAGEDVDLHDKLRREITALTLAKAGSIGSVRIYTLQAVALKEVLYPVKFAIY